MLSVLDLNGVGFAALGLALLSASSGLSSAATPEAEDTWASLANDIFGGRPLADGTGLVSIDMPMRADDAAIVPVTMRVTLPPDDSRRLKALTLVIDNNPVPVAATFTFSDSAGFSVISTRVRINSYTNVHVVAELSDSKLYVAQTYVKASGGCSAPAAKNVDEAIARRRGAREVRRSYTIDAPDQNSAGRYPLISRPTQISTRIGVVQVISRLPQRSRVTSRKIKSGGAATQARQQPRGRERRRRSVSQAVLLQTSRPGGTPR